MTRLTEVSYYRVRVGKSRVFSMRIWFDRSRRLARAASVFAAFGLSSTTAALAQTADLVFINGKGFTANDRSTLAHGLAVKDGSFIAVGSSQAMRAHVGPGSQAGDLTGRF